MTELPEPTTTLDQVLEFLYGAEQIDGQWWGDRPPAGKPLFWWRSKLRAAIAVDRLEQRRLGRLEGLEEAAKVADDMSHDMGELSAAIRALKEK